jgi:uncharacterized glyoxalase superfamily protein PhnB
MAVSAPTQDQQISPIPEGFHTITPTLIVDGAAAAIEFYVRAFGAVELFRAASPDGEKIMHAMIQIGDSKVMLGDEFPDWGCRGPRSVGGTPVSLHLYVEDADAFYEAAVAAGVTATMPICDAFWGDRYAKVVDPFGHEWAIASRKRIVGDEELAKAAQDCMP